MILLANAEPATRKMAAPVAEATKQQSVRVKGVGDATL